MSRDVLFACLLLAVGLGMAMTAVVRRRRLPRALASSTLPDGPVGGVARSFVGAQQALPSLQDEDDDQGPASSKSLVISLVEEGAELESTRANDLFEVHAAALTDPGAVRMRNEDAVLELPDDGLFVVADGMGGHAGGDIASQTAVRVLAEAIRSSAAMNDATDGGPRPVRRLVSAIESAHRAVREESARRGLQDDMGTTVVALHALKRRQQVVIAHVGDSRCYRLRDGVLTQLTRDHSLFAEGSVQGPLSAALRRALGIGRGVKVDTRLERTRIGDRFLLCSDGLTRVVAHEEIAAALGKNAPAEIASALVSLARERGGPDNVSVVAVEIVPAT